MRQWQADKEEKWIKTFSIFNQFDLPWHLFTFGIDKIKRKQQNTKKLL